MAQTKMVLLSYRNVGIVGAHQIGLLGELTIDRDLDIIQDVAVTHFKLDLFRESPFVDFSTATVVIKENSRVTFLVKIVKGKFKAERVYLMDEIPVLNDLIFPSQEKLS